MKSGGLFSTTISCGALAGICAGAVWVILISAVLKDPPQSMEAFFFENAFRAAACLAAVLCAPAIYHRKISLAINAAFCAVGLFIGAIVCGYFAWIVARMMIPFNQWDKLWSVFEILHISLLCPFLGGATGYFLARIYKIPSLHRRAIKFGVLGCAVHLGFGLFYSLARMLNWNLDSRDAMALHAMLAVMGYVYLGAICGVPFDIYFRSQNAGAK